MSEGNDFNMSEEDKENQLNCSDEGLIPELVEDINNCEDDNSNNAFDFLKNDVNMESDEKSLNKIGNEFSAFSDKEEIIQSSDIKEKKEEQIQSVSRSTNFNSAIKPAKLQK